MDDATYLNTEDDANVDFNRLHSKIIPTRPRASPQPPVVLLAWEHGRNLGHIGRLLAAAQAIEQQDARPVWAIPQAFMNATELCNLNHARFTVPTVSHFGNKVAMPIHSFTDILISFGFADTENLMKIVKA